ncbi:hypothetical protein RFI_21666 [Reticulomyxa filosa]|uniref:Uncharacterized protein n=1 Tax=Reticulomyxa filosa TaxID=46433 RepID=X6MQH2_RETFI|nr:hypothetical protein RFI_21666 [Reticulomyxa filosa]|eukprot:ETO15697.1 hypothetical protein RFI_21666 [Reticulomyxa filosa]
MGTIITHNSPQMLGKTSLYPIPNDLPNSDIIQNYPLCGLRFMALYEKYIDDGQYTNSPNIINVSYEERLCCTYAYTLVAKHFNIELDVEYDCIEPLSENIDPSTVINQRNSHSVTSFYTGVPDIVHTPILCVKKNKSIHFAPPFPSSVITIQGGEEEKFSPDILLCFCCAAEEDTVEKKDGGVASTQIVITGDEQNNSRLRLSVDTAHDNNNVSPLENVTVKNISRHIELGTKKTVDRVSTSINPSINISRRNTPLVITSNASTTIQLNALHDTLNPYQPRYREPLEAELQLSGMENIESVRGYSSTNRQNKESQNTFGSRIYLPTPSATQVASFQDEPKEKSIHSGLLRTNEEKTLEPPKYNIGIEAEKVHHLSILAKARESWSGTITKTKRRSVMRSLSIFLFPGTLTITPSHKALLDYQAQSIKNSENMPDELVQRILDALDACLLSVFRNMRKPFSRFRMTANVIKMSVCWNQGISFFYKTCHKKDKFDRKINYCMKDTIKDSSFLTICTLHNTPKNTQNLKIEKWSIYPTLIDFCTYHLSPKAS